MVFRAVSIGGGGGQARYLMAMKLLIDWLSAAKQDVGQLITISQFAWDAVCTLVELDVEVQLDAITTVADSGGSTGRLAIGGYLGDVTQCGSAIAQDEDLLSRLSGLCPCGPQGVLGRVFRGVVMEALRHTNKNAASGIFRDLVGDNPNIGTTLRERLNYRYPSGHSLKNLLLRSFMRAWGSQEVALGLFWHLIGIAPHRVMPVSFHRTDLVASHWDGSVTRGEAHLDNLIDYLDESNRPAFNLHRNRIKGITLDPKIPASEMALSALADAHLISYPPGDLHTSTEPALRVGGIGAKIRAARENGAPVVAVIPLVTKPWETPGYKVSDYLRVLRSATGTRIDWVICNDVEKAPLDPSVLANYHYNKHDKFYEAEAVTPGADLAEFVSRDHFKKAPLATVVEEGGKKVFRHDISVLAQTLLPIVAEVAVRMKSRMDQEVRV